MKLQDLNSTIFLRNALASIPTHYTPFSELSPPHPSIITLYMAFSNSIVRIIFIGFSSLLRGIYDIEMFSREYNCSRWQHFSLFGMCQQLRLRNEVAGAVVGCQSSNKSQ